MACPAHHWVIMCSGARAVRFRTSSSRAMPGAPCLDEQGFPQGHPGLDPGSNPRRSKIDQEVPGLGGSPAHMQTGLWKRVDPGSPLRCARDDEGACRCLSLPSIQTSVAGPNADLEPVPGLSGYSDVRTRSNLAADPSRQASGLPQDEAALGSTVSRSSLGCVIPDLIRDPIHGATRWTNKGSVWAAAPRISKQASGNAWIPDLRSAASGMTKARAGQAYSSGNSPSGGCQSSIALPSGSRKRKKRPYSSSS